LRERDLSALYWSVDSYDWKIHDADIVHQNVLRDMHAEWDARRFANVILFHDTQAPTPRVVDMLVPELQAEGCRFVLVDAIS
jgi:peptidoglycan/xylan/chitin deacetylase (PgdA/CDA1 family)